MTGIGRKGQSGMAVREILAGLLGLAGVAALCATASSSRAAATHWAFRPPTAARVPLVNDRSRLRTPVDAFWLAALERRKLAPAPEADPRTLLRRAALDLTGLLPTPDELSAFLADSSPRAYENAVDRLLASSAYGERWAQHWLDVIRYAETNGFEGDGDRPQAWRYRDWVVEALNRDLPYDQFLLCQIAGDELKPDDFQYRTATGFLRAGPQHVVGGNTDPRELRQEWLTEAVTGVGAGILGLTIQCARCHDHKFDPLPQADFYRLQAFFAGTANRDFRLPNPEEERAQAARVAAHGELLRPIRQQIATLEAPYRARLQEAKRDRLEPRYAGALQTAAAKRTPEQQRLAQDAQTMLKVDWDELVAALTPPDRERRAALRRQMHALDLQTPPPLPAAPGVDELHQPAPQTSVLVRGEWSVPGAPVQPAFPAALTDPGTPAFPADGTSRRTHLARWLTRPDHPLTARVFVNRVWLYHFGRGLVATPNDFGRHGAQPTHPELLDWLAVRFATPHSEGGLGWSLKVLHRLLVTSSLYRQASRNPATPAARDPDNRWYTRTQIRRLDAEAIRDTVLQAAGTLNPERGGAPVRVPLEPEVYDTIFTEGEPDNLWPVTPDPRQHRRRSLYLLHKRNVRLPLLAVFDQPDMLTPCGARSESVHALQALSLLNSDFSTEQSRALALRLFQEAPQDDAARVARLFALALCRPPGAAEARATRQFLAEQRRHLAAAGVPAREGLPPGVPAVELEVWTDLCLATLNRNDFLTWR
ncbi:MAG: DUF1553 domain-containing protein [Armatimonadetes bacterium]|nr:DUF1553 domain-containing protein [Armatimonadota bacterium]